MNDSPQIPTAVPADLDDVLIRVRAHFARYVRTTDPLDLDLLTLWTAHTHVCELVYSSPRLILDSTMPESGKTTTLEHLQRLTYRPMSLASLSSVALLSRVLEHGPRTLLIDEVDRALDPRKPETGEMIAIINVGYKPGMTRPVLVPIKGGGWEAKEMPTFAPVAMAGNSPHLPDDTRTRSVRILLMPDLDGSVEPSDWEDIEGDLVALAVELAGALELVRDTISESRPPLPAGCTGRMREKWRPLKRVAVAAGAGWPDVVDTLIRRDLDDVAAERSAGLNRRPPGVVLLEDLHTVWRPTTTFMGSQDLVHLLSNHNPEYWGLMSAYGKALTVKRMSTLLQHLKVMPTKNGQDLRGYNRWQFETPWQRHGLTPDAPTSPTLLNDDEPF
jgi:hypothetical protein